MKEYDEIPAFILAGGRSARMGEDKALFEIEGKPVIEHVAGTLTKLFTSITIAADQKEPYEFLGLPVQTDIIKESGPLGGIHAALVRTTARHIFVISCDLPFVPPKLIERIVERRFEADVVLPKDAELVQPLCAVYSRGTFHFVVKHLRERQFSVLRCLEDMKTINIAVGRNVNKDGFSVLTNIKSLEDFEKVRAVKD